MKNLTINTLRGLILAKDSVDDQIDSFLIKFENDSIKKEEEEGEVSKSLSEMSLRALLNEQEAAADEPDTDEPAEEDALPEDPDADEPIDSTAVDIDEPKDTPMMPIDIDAYIKRVARLAMNAEILLDVKSVVINRALNFLDDNYDKSHVSAAKEILSTQFDFDLNGSDNDPEAPFAAGAWAGGTGSQPAGPTG